MSPDITYIVVINEFYAYQVTVDMNIPNEAITQALKLHSQHLKNMDEIDEIRDLRVYQKIN